MNIKLIGAAVVVLLMGASAYGAFFVAPTELTMGLVQRIFYLHAPCGMTALAAFLVCFVGDVNFLRRREARWDLLAVLGGGVGVGVLGGVLFSGALLGP